MFIRNARDAMISLYEMYRKEKKLPNLSENRFLSIYDPIRQYQWEINSWVLNKPKNVFLVKFEDLKNAPIVEFKRIFEYIGLKNELAGNALNNMVATSDSKKRPRGTAYGWKKTYGEYDQIIKTVSATLNKEINLLGYDSL